VGFLAHTLGSSVDSDGSSAGQNGQGAAQHLGFCTLGVTFQKRDLAPAAAFGQKI